MTPDVKVYILRGLFGLLAAIICTVFNLTGSIGIGVGVLIYATTLLAIKYILKLTPNDFKTPEQVYINGLAPYLSLWLITWIIAYNFLIK